MATPPPGRPRRASGGTVPRLPRAAAGAGAANPGGLLPRHRHAADPGVPSLPPLAFAAVERGERLRPATLPRAPRAAGGGRTAHRGGVSLDQGLHAPSRPVRVWSGREAGREPAL